MLLYLNSFEEGRSWKGYDFNDLTLLDEEGLINENRGRKSIYLYDEGIEKAKALCLKYGVELPKE
jgi:hypothetical protein